MGTGTLGEFFSSVSMHPVGVLHHWEMKRRVKIASHARTCPSGEHPPSAGKFTKSPLPFGERDRVRGYLT